ncbi:hypothetical protein BFJ72_g5691 [Fusarium proliferatum]|uniref:Uncharacterized protein n=1 Tax=Gibberella intermedia TaxID=948311 RepID=A0A420TIP3_GIBIN|nr:hypothetical protein BFJ72_g5691 [Fusarium proliferatum]
MGIGRLGHDIRDKLGLSLNRSEICRKLQLQRPPGFTLLYSPNAFDTHGLDYLFMLVRHFYSQLLRVSFDKNKHKDAEKNPILALAWLDINFDAKDEWEDFKQSCLKGFNPSEAHDPMISLEGLVNSHLMRHLLGP